MLLSYQLTWRERPGPEGASDVPGAGAPLGNDPSAAARGAPELRRGGCALLAARSCAVFAARSILTSMLTSFQLFSRTKPPGRVTSGGETSHVAGHAAGSASATTLLPGVVAAAAAAASVSAPRGCAGNCGDVAAAPAENPGGSDGGGSGDGGGSLLLSFFALPAFFSTLASYHDFWRAKPGLGVTALLSGGDSVVVVVAPAAAFMPAGPPSSASPGAGRALGRLPSEGSLTSRVRPLELALRSNERSHRRCHSES